MHYLRFSVFDYVLFGSVFIGSSLLGIYFGCRGKTQSADDYFFGGKKLKTLPITISLAASATSGIALVSGPTETYMYGTQYVIVSFSILFVGIINNFFCLPLFHKLQLRNVYEYLELRFGTIVKSIVTIQYTLKNILYLSLVLYAPSIFLNQVSGINIYAISWILAVICIFYTSIGGFKAVVWTDTLQFLITFSTLAYLLIKGTISDGGVLSIWRTSAEGGRIEFFNMSPDPTIRSTFWSVLIGNIFSWMNWFIFDASSVQRFTSMPSLTNAKKASVVAITFIALTKVFSSFIGLIIYAKYAKCDPLSVGYIQKIDEVVPYFIMDVAKYISGVSGLFVAGLFTSSLSALSTNLNTASGILYFDFVALLLPEDISINKSRLALKVITLLLGLISACMVFLAVNLGSLFQLFYGVFGITSGPVLGLFILGMVFPVANKKGALVGLLSSVIIMSFIIIQNQIYTLQGSIKDRTKPFSTDGCNTTNYNGSAAVITRPASSAEIPEEASLWLYRISFHYYIMLGALLTTIIGLGVSAVTKSKGHVIRPELIIPCMRRFVAINMGTAEMVPQDEEPNITTHQFANIKESR